MDELMLGLLVVVLVAATGWITRNRYAHPLSLWTSGWIFFFAAGVLVAASADSPAAKPLVHLIGPFFPALMLGGTLGHVGRRVPAWLLPLAFAVGLLRWGLDQLDLQTLDHGIALVFDPNALLLAAFFAWRAVGYRVRWSRQHMLAPALVAVAGVELADSIGGLLQLQPTGPYLLGWALAAPFAGAVQVAASRGQILGLKREAELALRASEQRFRALAENAFDLVAEMDDRGRFTYTNPRYSEFSGIPPAELAGSRAVDLVHPDDQERTLAWFSEQRGANGDRPLTIRLRHLSGRWRWVETSGRTFETSEPGSAEPRKTLRIVAHSRDVTERIELGERLKREHDLLEERVERRTAQLHAAVANLEMEIAERRRVENDLRVSEEHWRELCELTSDLGFAVIRERDGSINREWATQALTRITGIDLEEIDERGWENVVHPDDVEMVLANLDAVQDGEAREYDARLMAADGGMRWIRTRITGAGATPSGGLRVLGAGRDITEAREAEEERRRLEAHMQEAQKLESLGVLAGGIAHDFNNLLAVILGNDALAMSEAQPGSRLAKQLERIRSAAKLAEALTDQMLTYSGKAAVSLKPLDVSGLVEEMSELLEAAISKKCRLDFTLDHGHTLVEGDPTQLRQVIMNLVTNASEALRDQSGRVAVRTGLMTAAADYLSDAFGASHLAPGEYVFLEVADPGEGIDAETRMRIFEPFFSTKFTGRGLGLASVLGIVRGHRGAIKLETEPGRGTSFRVLLPPATSAALPTPSEEPGPRPQARCGETAKVLVVDDDEAVLEVACEFLRRSGLDVVTAGGGREALAILRSDTDGKIDAAVVDLAMPDIDGSETLLEIRRLRPELPVVVASGFGESAGESLITGTEVAAFLRKPYEPQDLVDAVRNALA